MVIATSQTTLRTIVSPNRGIRVLEEGKVIPRGKVAVLSVGMKVIGKMSAQTGTLIKIRSLVVGRGHYKL